MQIYHLQRLCDVNSGGGYLQVVNLPEIASKKLLMVQVDASLFLKPPLGQFFEKFAYRKVLEITSTDLHPG